MSVSVGGEAVVADEVREVCGSLWYLLQFTICLEKTHSTGSNVQGCVFFECIQCPGLVRHTAKICQFNVLTEQEHCV